MTKGMNGINECVQQWFSHMKRKEKDRIAKRVYVGKCVGSCLVSRLQKRWINSLKDFLRKIGLDARQAKKMVQGRSEWLGFMRGMHGV